METVKLMIMLGVIFLFALMIGLLPPVYFVGLGV